MPSMYVLISTHLFKEEEERYLTGIVSASNPQTANMFAGTGKSIINSGTGFAKSQTASGFTRS